MPQSPHLHSPACNEFLDAPHVAGRPSLHITKSETAREASHDTMASVQLSPLCSVQEPDPRCS